MRGMWAKLVRPLGYDAGIRSIERTLNSVCRKVALSIVEGKQQPSVLRKTISKNFIEVY